MLVATELAAAEVEDFVVPADVDVNGVEGSFVFMQLLSPVILQTLFALPEGLLCLGDCAAGRRRQPDDDARAECSAGGSQAPVANRPVAGDAGAAARWQARVRHRLPGGDR